MEKSRKDNPQERRRYSRYDTDLNVQFRVNFDIKTKVQVRLQKGSSPEGESFPAVSRNISSEGMAFVCQKDLHAGARVLLEVFVPSAAEPVIMEGDVRWCQPEAGAHTESFLVGVKILTVSGQAVEPSIVYDKIHNVYWSIVLESVFSHFKNLTGRHPQTP